MPHNSPSRPVRRWVRAVFAHRTTHSALVRNPGRPPYGYTTMTVAGSRSRWTPEPRRSLVVQDIFYWRAVTGLSIEDIAARLDVDHDRYPPPGTDTAWSPDAVAAILTTVRYTGYQATGTRDENGCLRPAGQWVLSAQPTHRALVTPALFWAAQNPATSVRATRDDGSTP
ncbi:recombinase family protein [Amycolatopsis japonica]|uniref:recombinase family protein n=1 Tax=Amycolatopsis japonica TaxID=208439 RepID=UPI00366CB8A9